MMKDIHSRRLATNEVHASETSEHGARLLMQGCLREGLAGGPLALHTDNGAAMEGSTMLASMHNPGVMSSFSRPRVSNDNAYVETLFRTAKYYQLWPQKPFDTLAEARAWVQRFVQWNSEEHRHSGIRYVTPAQRHYGEAPEFLQHRVVMYEVARKRKG